MKCYRMNCEDRDRCDKYKMAACIRRINESQNKARIEILTQDGLMCKKCRGKAVRARYSSDRRPIALCTSCGAVAERQVG